jgi:hypothetical protein
MEFLSVECDTESHSTVTTASARRRVTRRPRDRWTVVVGPEIRYVWSAILQLPASNCTVPLYTFTFANKNVFILKIHHTYYTNKY